MSVIKETEGPNAGKYRVDYDAVPAMSNAEQWDQEFDDPRYHTEEYLRDKAEIEKRIHDRKPAAATVEAAQSQYQANIDSEKVRECRWLHQDELTEFVPGTIIHCNEFLSRLKHIRPDASYNEFAVLGRRGLNFYDPVLGRDYFVTTVQNGPMIEWSQMRTDAHGIPTTEKYRGWRQVLCVLIDKEIITIEQADREFGAAKGPRSSRWYRWLYCRRNHRCPECGKKVCDCKTRYDDLRSDQHRSTETAETEAALRAMPATEGRVTVL